jgi:hypothetical protein
MRTYLVEVLPPFFEIAILVDAMLRAREVVASRSWSTSQEPTTEHWWADVLADPRARIRRQPWDLYGRDSKRTARKSHYRLADEPSPMIEVARSKCEWKAGFSRAEVVALYGEEYSLPNLLDHLAMPGCTKIKSQWDRCGVYYVNPLQPRIQLLRYRSISAPILMCSQSNLFRIASLG